ncbi:hypothetical protein BC829DRAFT_406597 [Chytridium lagenaria]|nr:hypothetical protein BC829DRAFT_406597 [Chytridium lagenaria]
MSDIPRDQVGLWWPKEQNGMKELFEEEKKIAEDVCWLSCPCSMSKVGGFIRQERYGKRQPRRILEPERCQLRHRIRACRRKSRRSKSLRIRRERRMGISKDLEISRLQRCQSIWCSYTQLFVSAAKICLLCVEQLLILEPDGFHCLYIIS